MGKRVTFRALVNAIESDPAALRRHWEEFKRNTETRLATPHQPKPPLCKQEHYDRDIARMSAS
jgi:hypothetical protein